MQVELDPEQTALLREVLDVALRDLRYEIAAADLPSYREMLRHRRVTMEALLDMVGGPIPEAERLKP